MRHPLDRPAWSALASRHASFAEGGDDARRYAAGLPPFVAARDDTAAGLAALERLVKPGEGLFLLQADAIVLPEGLVATLNADAVQLVAERPLAAPRDGRVMELGLADADEMVALAELTRPGPFTPDALKLGRFWGIRSAGRLAAMAGERMKQDGFTEVSGVCTHPDFRGQGLAKLLSLVVAGEVFAEGAVPYLHAYVANAAAVGLYEAIGFRVRAGMKVARWSGGRRGDCDIAKPFKQCGSEGNRLTLLCLLDVRLIAPRHSANYVWCLKQERVMRDMSEIAGVVKRTLSDTFDNVEILKVIVSDDDDDAFLNIEVIFEGTPKDLDARKVSGAVRHIRPKLAELGEHAFPLLSFISRSDVPKLAAS